MASIFPTLKPGVAYFVEHNQERSQIHVGAGAQSVTLFGHNAIYVIPKCNGQFRLSDICDLSKISTDEVLLILQPLIEHGLLYLSNRALTVSNVKANSEDINNLNARALGELNLVSWRGDKDPMFSLVRRSNCKIEIIGSSKIAFNLFSILVSSGYIKTKINYQPREYVGANLVGETLFSEGDLGQKLKAAIRRKRREIGLNLAPLIAKGEQGTSELFEEEPAILIFTQNLLPDQIQDLMYSGIAHLQISNFQRGYVEIGPLIIPGQTPCLNCVNNWRSEARESFEKINILNRVADPLDISAAATAFLAGLIVSLVDNYFASGSSFLIGSSVVIDLAHPLNYIERFWQPNPSCGCLELL